MRTHLIAIACACLCSAFAPGSAVADTLDDVKARDALICGVLTGYEPYSYQDPKERQLTGYEVDLCTELAKFLGVKIELKVVTTQGRIPEITQGRVDVLAARISYTKERAQQVDYTGIYDRVIDRFMIMRASGLQAADMKRGKRIGVSKGTPLDQFLRERYPDSTAVSFDDLSLGYAALKAAKIDAFLAPTTTLVTLQSRDPGESGAIVLPESIYPLETSFIVRKGEDRFRSAIDQFLQQAETSGLALRIYDKYLGDGSRYKLPREFTVGLQPAQ